jgi:hypothetical protein
MIRDERLVQGRSQQDRDDAESGKDKEGFVSGVYNHGQTFAIVIESSLPQIKV